MDLEVQHPHEALEHGVVSIVINTLSIYLLYVLVPHQVGTTEEIPALGIRWVCEK